MNENEVIVEDTTVEEMPVEMPVEVAVETEVEMPVEKITIQSPEEVPVTLTESDVIITTRVGGGTDTVYA